MDKISREKILIVEDESRLRETWNEIFQIFGVSPYLAKNGLEAKNIIENHPIEIVVTDIQMPIADGYFVLNFIKSNNLKIKTIVCTGQLDDKAFFEFDIEKIILKPFNMITEVEYVLSLLDKS